MDKVPAAMLSGGGGGGGAPTIWSPFVVTLTQSAAKTPIAHTSDLEHLIIGGAGFVIGYIEVDGAGTGGQPIEITLPVLLADKRNVTLGGQAYLVGIARWVNPGFWHKMLDVYLSPNSGTTGLILQMSVPEEYRPAGTSPTNALDAADLISLHLMIPLRSP